MQKLNGKRSKKKGAYIMECSLFSLASTRMFSLGKEVRSQTLIQVLNFFFPIASILIWNIFIDSVNILIYHRFLKDMFWWQTWFLCFCLFDSIWPKSHRSWWCSRIWHYTAFIIPCIFSPSMSYSSFLPKIWRGLFFYSGML